MWCKFGFHKWCYKTSFDFLSRQPEGREEPATGAVGYECRKCFKRKIKWLMKYTCPSAIEKLVYQWKGSP